MTEVKGNLMKVEVKFNDPYSISASGDTDTLKVTINDLRLLTSE